MFKMPIEEIQKEEKILSDKLLKIIEGDNVLKALVDAVLISMGFPLASLFTTGIKGILSYMIQGRIETFFTQLKENPGKISEQSVQSQEFVHKFIITYNAVCRMNSQDKIKLLANLLANGADSEEISVDEFEEVLAILEGLSNREIAVLVKFEELYNKTPEKREAITAPRVSVGGKPLVSQDSSASSVDEQKYKDFEEELHDYLERTLSIKKEYIKGFLIRLSRSGLYEQFVYMDGYSGAGKLTPEYFKIKELIISK